VSTGDFRNIGAPLTNTLIQITAPIENRDDRPAEALSFAASNLVKPGLSSRRQQSEPPTNRNVFPPTPPPENDKLSRGASVRGSGGSSKPVPSRLNLEKVRSNERYERASPDDARPRPTRSASTAPSRGFSQRGEPRRRRDDDDDYPEDVYDMYGGGNARNSRSQRSVAGSRSARDRYIEEDDEEGSDYDDASFDEGEFEMVSNTRRGPGSVAGGSKRGSTRRETLKTVRIKVHAPGDVRYVAVGPAVEFPDLVQRIQDKFGLRRRFKIKVKDEDSPDGEMITMGDQDDLDMVMTTVKQNARKMRSDTGKLEVSLQKLL
jgi:hypothetical protein